MAFFATVTLHSQTVKLPTKKTTGTTVQQETATPKTEVVPQKEVTPQKSQSGTITLPTKKVDSDQALPQTGTNEITALPVSSDEGNNVITLPVVKRKTAPRAKPIVKRPKKEDNEIYESAEHMPTYPGGAAELVNFIEKNIRYPQEALNDSIQDIIQVSFIVEKDGSTTDFEVIDEHHPALEAEAVRVLQQMPKWKPATQNGVKVRVEYVVPVKFKITN